jgi:hypothetical protein
MCCSGLRSVGNGRRQCRRVQVGHWDVEATAPVVLVVLAALVQVVEQVGVHDIAKLLHVFDNLQCLLVIVHNG